MIISDERHLSYPMWVYTNLYRQGGMYYLIIVQGSHTAAEKSGKIYFMPSMDWKGAAHELEENGGSLYDGSLYFRRRVCL